MTVDRPASLDLTPPRAGAAWPLCGECRHYASGLCTAEAWAAWPERDGDELACSEFMALPA